MAKYLAIVTYTAEGLKGLMAGGGTATIATSGTSGSAAKDLTVATPSISP